ncbi:DNA mismatch repair protein MutS [bioreactor metagenome]|uniref:DNA mismatch repair protein MutS n=1 Tax=bioreactor metagenome TaxID=1076179 RepID=A0A645HDE2_9ZZZZ
MAKLAGLPESVIERAKDVLEEIETEQGFVKPFQTIISDRCDDDVQVSLEDINGNQVIERIRDLSIETLTPIEAINLLYEFKKTVT